ncbi:hypothetical protein FQN51_006222 [Onygenales sp. PD_10]|nr:hypothetical protein FQN51_006222 [Onygenales sp. PD_10]
MATTTESQTGYTQIELATAYGPAFRQVSTAEPRNATLEEIPIIDISGIYGTLEDRKNLAANVKNAAELHGFFYIKNHGINGGIINAALEQTRIFFAQSLDKKDRVSKEKSAFYNGYSRPKSSQISRTESRDTKEAFMFRYDPQYDPETKDLNNIPPAVQSKLMNESFFWEETRHLPGFQDAYINYWQACLTLSRRLIRIFALALDLPETYFDSIVTYPGADAVMNFYPAMHPADIPGCTDVGIGSHTDMQCFTLLWQDMVGGLQILNSKNEWIKATPIQDTMVVNIGDFLMRLSNDRFKSTVHRVYNHCTVDRISMPFFFGFNYNEECSVVPTCTDENNPPKYEPISCGEPRIEKSFNLAT